MQRFSADNLVKIYSRRKVVNGVSIEVKEKEIVGLLGPNGAGKTTSFYMMVGLISPHSGTVNLNGEDVTDFAMYKRARQGIGYLAQEPSIFRQLTVRENIMAILENFPISKDEKEKKLQKLLNEFNIARLANNKAYLLSGGEKRRVEIARTLVSEPNFILLDEPFTGIDPIAVVDIQQIIFKLREKGLGVLITDHNVRETLKIIDRAYLIYEGKILFAGTAKDLLENEEARKVYLGEEFSM
ncbi:MAG: LPS export ABC transporter ATP-binding protein [bacterium]